MFPHTGLCLRTTTLLTAAISFIAGCTSDGGSSESGSTGSRSNTSNMCFQTTIENCGPGPWDPFGIALSFAWASGQCTKEVLCTTEPVVSEPDNGIVTEEFINTNWTTSSATESEPNNATSEADAFVLQGSSGILFTGTVNDASDPADILAISFGEAGPIPGYVAYLCRTPDVCLQPFYEGNAAYLELIDQNGLVVQTTEFNPTHSFLFDASPGMLFYVAVRAANTGGANFDYKLVVTD